MNKSVEFRKLAEDCVEMAQATQNEPKRKRLNRLAEGWNKLAENQAWLDGESPETPPPKAA